MGTPPEHRIPVLHLLQGTTVRPNAGEGPIGRSDPSKRVVLTSASQIWPASTKKAAISLDDKQGSSPPMASGFVRISSTVVVHITGSECRL
ncbi:hypothetical protein ACLOJK_014947 [Asimina triloba]